MPKRIDLLNRTFERLTVIEKLGLNKVGAQLWLCRCRCGQETTSFTAQLLHDKKGSCGCLKFDRREARSRGRVYEATTENEAIRLRRVRTQWLKTRLARAQVLAQRLFVLCGEPVAGREIMQEIAELQKPGDG